MLGELCMKLGTGQGTQKIMRRWQTRITLAGMVWARNGFALAALTMYWVFARLGTAFWLFWWVFCFFRRCEMMLLPHHAHRRTTVCRAWAA